MGWSCWASAISQLCAQRNTQEGKEASNVISMGCRGSMLLPKDIFCEFPSSTHLNPAPSPSWGWQVPPLAQGLEEQPLSATSQSLP